MDGNSNRKQHKGGRTSKHDPSIHRHVFRLMDGENTILLSFSKNTKLQILGSATKILWKQKENAFEINIPASQKSATDYVWVIKVTN